MIKDRNHVHMKATCWTTLSGFVQYLGKTGKAIIEEAPRGWYITYVEKDPDVLEMQRKARDMEKIEMSEQERNEKRIQMQVEHAYKSLPQSSSSHGASSSHELKEASNQPLKLGFKSIEQKKTRKIKSIFEDEDLNEDLELLSTAADEFAWITPNIIVKILNPDIEDGAFYKQKGVIVNVHDQFIAEIKLLKLDAVVRIDQVELETVLPAIGNDVLFVGKGIYNGLTARLEGIDEKSYSASITFTTGDVAGKTIHGVEYEQICKLNSAESKKP
jgi:DNA/RNA-binding protein KIN17